MTRSTAGRARRPSTASAGGRMNSRVVASTCRCTRTRSGSRSMSRLGPAEAAAVGIAEGTVVQGRETEREQRG